jgi:hypothetical protein
VTHLASALFFIAALLGAAVMLHLIVRQYWDEILLALRGELGLEVRMPAGPDRPRAAATPMRRAAS